MGIGDRDYMRSDDQAGIGWVHRRAGRGSGRPSVLAIIIGMNICIFVLQFAGLGWEVVTLEDGRQGEVPWGWTGMTRVFEQGHVWTLVTYMFVHGGLFHILVNLLMIYVCGRPLIMMIGERNFLKIYFIAGVLGALLQLPFTSDPLVGASAAAFGLLAALATMIPQQQVTVLLYFVLPIRLRMKYLAYGIVGMSLVFFVIDLLLPEGTSVPMVTGIGHAAHLGGALAGWLFVRFFKLGGIGITRDVLQRQREKSEGRAGRRLKRAARVRKATVVSTAEGVAEITPSGDFVSAEIDPILDKINREGFGSLSADERKVLEKGSKKISKRANS